MLLTLYRLALATALFIPFVNALPLIARDEVSRPIKFFELNLTQAWAAPDGFERLLYHINDQGPAGPEIIVNEGDQVRVLVNNGMEIPTTIHWHGIFQDGTYYSDGVPGVSQSLILPGQSFLYDFPVDQYGLYWYHSHNRMYHGDGVHGALLVRPNEQRQRPFTLISQDQTSVKAMEQAESTSQTVFLSDWNHTPASEVFAEYQASGVEPLCLDSVLLNGRGRVHCPDKAWLQTVSPPLGPLTAKGCLQLSSSILSGNLYNDTVDRTKVRNSAWLECNATDAPYPVFEVEAASGWASFGFVNGGSNWPLTVSIDNHPMWVYERDGQFIIPQKIESISLPLGERVRVLIELDEYLGVEHTIRVPVSGGQAIAGFGVLRYKAHDTAQTPVNVTQNLPAVTDKTQSYVEFTGAPYNANTSFDVWNCSSFPPEAPPQRSNKTIILSIDRPNPRTWVIYNDAHYSRDHEEEDPLLWDPRSLTNLTASVDTWDVVDLIIDSHPNQPVHPIHKHGHRAWLLGHGVGQRNWTTVDEGLKLSPEAFNLKDPYYGDGFPTLTSTTTEPSWTVVRWQALPGEAGPVPLHCHINPHSMSGMFMVLMQSQDSFAPLPEQYRAGGNGIPKGWVKPAAQAWGAVA